MRPRTVLSMEQALSLSYGTLRFAQLGWRVIRLESAPRPGQKTPGDPNRYVGRRRRGRTGAATTSRPTWARRRSPSTSRARRGGSCCSASCASCRWTSSPATRCRGATRSWGSTTRRSPAANEKLIWVGVSAMGPDYPDAPGLRPGAAGAARLHGPDRPAGRPADADGRADGRPQGRRRGLRPDHARPGRAGRDGAGDADRHLHGPGRRLLAAHDAAAARPRRAARGCPAQRQRAPGVRAGQRLRDRGRLALPGDRQRRAVAPARVARSVRRRWRARAGRPTRAGRRSAPRSARSCPRLLRERPRGELLPLLQQARAGGHAGQRASPRCARRRECAST